MTRRVHPSRALRPAQWAAIGAVATGTKRTHAHRPRPTQTSQAQRSELVGGADHRWPCTAGCRRSEGRGMRRATRATAREHCETARTARRCGGRVAVGAASTHASGMPTNLLRHFAHEERPPHRHLGWSASRDAPSPRSDQYAHPSAQPVAAAVPWSAARAAANHSARARRLEGTSPAHAPHSCARADRWAALWCAARHVRPGVSSAA